MATNNTDLPEFLAIPKPPNPIRRIVPGDVLPEPKRFDRELGPKMHDSFTVFMVGVVLFLAGILVALCMLPRP